MGQFQAPSDGLLLSLHSLLIYHLSVDKKIGKRFALLDKFAPLCHAIRSKPKPIVTRWHTISRASRGLRVFVWSFDSFIGLSVLFVIGQSRLVTLVSVLRHSVSNHSIIHSITMSNARMKTLIRACALF